MTGPSTPFASNCVFKPIPSWSTVSFASSFAFDSIVLGLTVAKLWPNKVLQDSRIGRQLFRDTLLYFSVTTVTNIVTLAIESLKNQPTLIQPATIPFSTLVTVAMGSRVYLNLRLLDQRERRQPPAETATLSSNASGTGKWRVATSERSEFGSSFVRTQLSSYPPTEIVMDIKPGYDHSSRDYPAFISHSEHV